MIPTYISAAIFLLVAWHRKSITYHIVAISYFLNFALDMWTTEDMTYLLVYYACLDFITGVLIIELGDKDQTYQATCSVGFLLLNSWIALKSLTVLDEQTIHIYMLGINALIITQIMGALNVKRIGDSVYVFWNHRRKISNTVDSDNTSHI